MKFCVYYLTCKGQEEADRVINVLLAKKLIVCAKYECVKSTYFWKGKAESADEIRIIMEAAEENFEKIEEEVGKIHSYDTFVLYTIPIRKMNRKVEKWMKEEIEI